MSNRKEIARTLLSGVGIVASILLAFAIDAAWDARGEHLAEAAALAGIREEFQDNLNELTQLLAQHRWADSVLDRAYAAPNPGTEEEAKVRVDSLVVGLLVGNVFDPNTGTLDMLLTGGGLDLLSDPELRALLLTWKRQLADLEDEIVMLQANAREGQRLVGRLGARGIAADLRPSSLEQYGRLRSSQELSAQAWMSKLERGIYERELETLEATTERVLEAIR